MGLLSMILGVISVKQRSEVFECKMKKYWINWIRYVSYSKWWFL